MTEREALRPPHRSAERRYDRYGELRWMAEAEGYVMCRRRHCFPSVIPRNEWDALSPVALGAGE